MPHFKEKSRPPGAYHRLSSYTDYIGRGGKVKLPHMHLRPCPVPGLHCEWETQNERKNKRNKKAKDLEYPKQSRKISILSDFLDLTRTS